METTNKSPIILGTIHRLKEYLNSLNIKYKVEGNNFYIFSLDDYYKIEDEQFVKSIKIKNKIKIDKISILGKKINIYDIDDEYIKIIYNGSFLNYIKYHLLNLLDKF